MAMALRPEFLGSERQWDAGQASLMRLQVRVLFLLVCALTGAVTYLVINWPAQRPQPLGRTAVQESQLPQAAVVPSAPAVQPAGAPAAGAIVFGAVRALNVLAPTGAVAGVAHLTAGVAPALVAVERVPAGLPARAAPAPPIAAAVAPAPAPIVVAVAAPVPAPVVAPAPPVAPAVARAAVEPLLPAPQAESTSTPGSNRFVQVAEVRSTGASLAAAAATATAAVAVGANRIGVPATPPGSVVPNRIGVPATQPAR